MQVINPGNAIAWNPSTEGLKVEDTLITNENDFEFITLGSNWPTVEVLERKRPAIQEIL
jgi:hypothetical protein